MLIGLYIALGGLKKAFDGCLRYAYGVDVCIDMALEHML